MIGGLSKGPGICGAVGEEALPVYRTPMNTIDLLGFMGVAMILLAYFLNLTQKLEPHHIAYILLNLLGATMACMASLLIAYYPFVILEGTWAMVSFVALINYLREG